MAVIAYLMNSSAAKTGGRRPPLAAAEPEVRGDASSQRNQQLPRVQVIPQHYCSGWRDFQSSVKSYLSIGNYYSFLEE